MLRKEDIDSALVGKRLTEANTGFCGTIDSVYRNPNGMFVVGYRNSVGLQSFSYENIKELLEKSETSTGVRKYRLEQNTEECYKETFTQEMAIEHDRSQWAYDVLKKYGTEVAESLIEYRDMEKNERIANDILFKLRGEMLSHNDEIYAQFRVKNVWVFNAEALDNTLWVELSGPLWLGGIGKHNNGSVYAPYENVKELIDKGSTEYKNIHGEPQKLRILTQIWV